MKDLVQICNLNFSFSENFFKRIHKIKSCFRQLKIKSSFVLTPAVSTLAISSWKYFLTPVLHNWLVYRRLFLNRSLFCWLLLHWLFWYRLHENLLRRFCRFWLLKIENVLFWLKFEWKIRFVAHFSEKAPVGVGPSLYNR